jgi:predicted permease
MLRDLQYGLRQFRKNKLFSAVVILLLATGIGANALIFSFINTLLLKPLPVRNPENLFLLEENNEQQIRPETSFTYRQFEHLVPRQDLFSAVVAERQWAESNMVPLVSDRTLRLIMPQIVSPNYFSELGVRALFGRVLTEADAVAVSDIPVVLSYQFWESQYNRNPQIIGRSIRLKNHPFLIVGVLPRDFHSLDIERAPDVRLPVSAAPLLYGNVVQDLAFDGWGFHILARLRPRVSPVRAAEEIRLQTQTIDEWEARELNPRRSPPLPKEELEKFVQRIHRYKLAWQPAGRGISQLRDQFSQALKLLMGAVVLLLLVVCANIAGLLLSKSEDRRREIAVRLSIGASRSRILRQLFSENALLALPGAAVGIALSYALSPFMMQLLPPARGLDQFMSPRILTVAPDWRVLLVTTTLCALSVVVFGLAPAWRGVRLDLNSELQRGGRANTRPLSGVGPVSVQVALCAVLLSAAGLMTRTFWNLQHLNPGFDRAHIVSFTISSKDAGYSGVQTASFLRQLKEEISALPGVRSAAYAGRGLMRGAGVKTTASPKGIVLPPTTFMNTSLNSVSPTYFETMGIPLLAGRNLAPGDDGKKPAPIVINRALADLLFPHQDAVGKFIVQGSDGTKPPMWQVAGVAGTAKYRSMREHDPPTFYGLFDEKNNSPVVLYVRSYGNPAPLIGAVRDVLRKLNPAVQILEVAALEQEVQNSLWQERLVALLSAFFGITALLLAAIGLYGALACSVARRRRELGIRIAVGAQIRHIVQAVCSQLTLSVILGLAAGLVASLLVLGVTRRLLYGIEPLDAASLVVTAVAVLLCTALAALAPSWRAAKTDPSTALRDE